MSTQMSNKIHTQWTNKIQVHHWAFVKIVDAETSKESHVLYMRKFMLQIDTNQN